MLKFYKFSKLIMYHLWTFFLIGINILKCVACSCRYMGTIVGISDYDPVRWPNSRWRNLQVSQILLMHLQKKINVDDWNWLTSPFALILCFQVEWDEHGYGERPDRVSLWEIETPESLFAFPNVTSSLKRQCLPGYVGECFHIAWKRTLCGFSCL